MTHASVCFSPGTWEASPQPCDGLIVLVFGKRHAVAHHLCAMLVRVGHSCPTKACGANVSSGMGNVYVGYCSRNLSRISRCNLGLYRMS